MKYTPWLWSLLALLPIQQLQAQQSTPTYQTQQGTDKNGYRYEQVPGDPLKARIYTLANGLKVYLSTYRSEPRIQTLIAVKAGGKFDPAQATGLAHYLEHIMFKGTDHFGTANWEQERVLLDSIEGLFEHYRGLTDPAARKACYQQIDQLSNRASQLAIANEYDKLVSSLGAKGTNAYTTEDRTVYMNDIPANELDRWLELEADRFRTVVPRLFHTELEAVYEEKNRSLDNDDWQVYETMAASVFPTHKYGTQTVIGTIDHLKNPSITEVKRYFERYYRPNNVAICLSGDLDPEQTIALIDKHFGKWQPAALPPYQFTPEQPIKGPVVKEVWGPNPASVSIGFRLPGQSSNSRDFLIMKVADMVLANGKAGLIDLNLKQQQKVLEAYSGPNISNDYTLHLFYGMPVEGQSLEQVKDLLLEQIALLKAGQFPDWLPSAVVTDFRKSRMYELEQNWARASAFVTAFSNELSWADYLSELEQMKTISKQEIVDFANRYYTPDNYVVVYKREGENPNKQQIEKPQITKVALNREQASPFATQLLGKQAQALKPQFLDFKKDIGQTVIQQGKGKLPLRYLQNKENPLFELQYVFPFGQNEDPTLEAALGFLNFMGTDQYSAEQLKQEFYKLGCSFRTIPGKERTTVVLSGLSEHMEEAMRLLESLLRNPKQDAQSAQALQQYVANTLKQREDLRQNKDRLLFSGLAQYATYGPVSPLRNALSNAQLERLQVGQLAERVKGLWDKPHKALYYGPMPQQQVAALLKAHHQLPTQAGIAQRVFAKTDAEKPKVYWTHFDMVQAEVLFLAKGPVYDPQREAGAMIFNEYFGGNMSSVLFQEMREAQGLAYSVFAEYGTAEKKADTDALLAYIGTQSDKLEAALQGMQTLLRDMPLNEQAFQTAKTAVLSKLESSRTLRMQVLERSEQAERLGLDYDINQQVYEAVKKMQLQDLQRFHQQYVQQGRYQLCVVGDRSKLDLQALAKYGEVRELSFEEMFGFGKQE